MINEQAAYQVIVQSEIDDLSMELLSWSDLSDRWDRWELYESDYNFQEVIVSNCDKIYIDTEECETGFACVSVWATVGTYDVNQLKSEMRTQLAKFLWKNRQLILKAMHDRREAEIAAEIARKNLRPTNYTHICSTYDWYDMFPEETQYHIEFLTLPNPGYQLWEYDFRYWTPKGVHYLEINDIKKLSITLLKKHFSDIRKVSLSPGEILTEDDIDKIKNGDF